MDWEVYALRYGTQARIASANFIQPPDPHDAPMPLDFFVWLLRSGTRQIVVDTGFRGEGELPRNRRIIRNVETALAQMKCDAARVHDVIITHLHYDHAGNLDLFPAAQFHLQDREMNFASGRNMCVACLRHAFDVEDVVKMLRAVYADRVRFHDGDAQIAPGVSVHHVGGHTDGLQMVRVQTARGPVVLASDAAHFYANYEKGVPFPIVYNVGDMARGWSRALELADGDVTRVIPGHDPDVRTHFPAVAGSNGETVALHLAPRARG